MELCQQLGTPSHGFLLLPISLGVGSYQWGMRNGLASSQALMALTYQLQRGVKLALFVPAAIEIGGKI